MDETERGIKNSLAEFIQQDGFPCEGARTALQKAQLHVHRYGDIQCGKRTTDLLADIYQFADTFSLSDHMYSSFVAVFEHSRPMSERCFETALWQKLQDLHNIDARMYDWDQAVSDDVTSADFSFSLGGHAFFVIGLNPASRRRSRQFEFPALVFNLHQQFEYLRDKGTFTRFRDRIRERDAAFCGTPNPMLANHGEGSEVLQYSGRELEKEWKCPLKVRS